MLLIHLIGCSLSTYCLKIFLPIFTISAKFVALNKDDCTYLEANKILFLIYYSEFQFWKGNQQILKVMCFCSKNISFFDRYFGNIIQLFKCQIQHFFKKIGDVGSSLTFSHLISFRLAKRAFNPISCPCSACSFKNISCSFWSVLHSCSNSWYLKSKLT